MITPIPLFDGGAITPEMLRSWQQAIDELQRYAIQSYVFPLQKTGTTLLCNLQSNPILFGTPTATGSSSSSSSGSSGSPSTQITITINWTIPTTIGSGFTISGSNLVIPSSAIIPYQKAQDGLYYIIGQPRLLLTGFQWSAPNLQMKMKYDFGFFTSTETDWQTIAGAESCQCSSSSSESSSSMSSSSTSSSSSSSSPATTITLTPCDVNGIAL
jgi:hypothetical protein